MPDDSVVMWTEIPVGSRFKLQCDGRKSDYDFSALVGLNDQPQPNIEIGDVDPGPAVIPIDENDQRWDIAPTLIVMRKLTKAITLKASVVDKHGNVVQVPSGTGKKIPAQAEWKSGTTAGSTLEVSILLNSEEA
jgi:hypothetical protein